MGRTEDEERPKFQMGRKTEGPRLVRDQMGKRGELILACISDLLHLCLSNDLA